jgi:alanyl-tRNA synthetase
MYNSTTCDDVVRIYTKQCAEHGIPFELIKDPTSYDTSTLFCPAGMQKYKAVFRDPLVTRKTVANVQTCIRLNDIDLVGDGTHAIAFDMIGLFSFRDWSVKQAVEFFHEFLSRCKVKLDHVTIHPDKRDEWSCIHPTGVLVKEDAECKWSDGEVGGYCTEFYALDAAGNALEIGNVVNPLGDCIDVGFGLERIARVKGDPIRSKCEELFHASSLILASGVKPGNTQQGYVLRKILRQLDKVGGTIDHQFFYDEQLKRIKAVERYHRLLPKHTDKSPAWWWDTHGISVEDVK